MINNFSIKHGILTVAIMATSSQISSAATLLVDFGATGGGNGTTTEGGIIWNAFEPGVNGSNLTGTSTATSLVDSTGAASTIELSMAWSTASGIDFSRSWDLHTGDRDGDYLGLRGDNPGAFNTTIISGLDANELYDITVWTQASTDFRVNGGTDVEVLGVENTTTTNAALSHTFVNVTSDGSGEITLDWGHISTDRGANQWASITAFSIADAIPEPSSVALLGLGSVMFLTRRRR